MHVRGSRPELSAPANYARFYVSDIFRNSTIKRFMYLDDDTVAIGSIEKLWETNLQGKILGMADDCSVGKESRFNNSVIKKKVFKQLYNLTHPIVLKAFNYTFDYECFPNAGILLVDEVLYQKSKIRKEMGMFYYSYFNVFI